MDCTWCIDLWSMDYGFAHITIETHDDWKLSTARMIERILHEYCQCKMISCASFSVALSVNRLSNTLTDYLLACTHCMYRWCDTKCKEHFKVDLSKCKSNAQETAEIRFQNLGTLFLLWKMCVRIQKPQIRGLSGVVVIFFINQPMN